ncbi:phage tail sheath subtilisin-like domain-containing protein [Sorangium sp. So ce375]|uniref:phage tail sheath family protein n=1 Tax=Sorangium sp. So ce375 TaxID=3133306 RepID=UPI003F5C75ED
MPEYLAPGVYVEETSFRAKSLEGVSTSTTGFVGPTRRGPVAPSDPNAMPEIPELLTSFGDFQRIYGGFDDLQYGTNYLAHAVRAYFDNGGSRLYVARVVDAAAGTAASGNLAASISFVARSPGQAGNGTITLIPHFTDATKRSMDRAPQGTVVRVGAKSAARARGAQLVGNRVGPWSLPRDGRLMIRLTSAGANNTPGTGAELTLAGSPAEAQAQNAIPAPLDLAAATEADRTLTVRIDGAEQTVVLPAADGQTRDEVVALINRSIVGGYARLEGDRLVIGSDVQGSASRALVPFTGAAAGLGFTAEVSAAGSGDLPNVRRVTLQDLVARLAGFQGGEVTPSTDALGNLVLTTATAGAGLSLLSPTGGAPILNALLGFAADAADTGTTGGAVTFYYKDDTGWLPESGAGGPLALGLDDNAAPNADGTEFVTLGVIATDADGISKTYDDLGLAPEHPRYIGRVLADNPSRRSDQLENVFAFRDGGATVAQLRQALLNNAGLPPIGQRAVPVRTVSLIGGTDGGPPGQASYEAGLRQLAVVEGISIVAAPGESRFPDHQGIQGALITHCERRRAYRIAVLDTAPGLVISGAQAEKARIDSTYAALYYPWVVVSNPLARVGDESIPREIALPPSGFVCGIYARTDVTRGVFKAPANEVVRGALRYEVDVNFAQQEVLNPAGVNCLRFFPGRGNRVWGARTASSDPEWKYVNVRRYFNYIERTLDVGTQWAVFEPNGERLWANIRETVSSFLVNEWRSGALLGGSPREAFFVRCDRSTMDQNDLDNGRLICLVGVAVVKPAEFVVFRIGQKTADARS